MLLIKNNAVSDSIMDYDSKVKTLYIAQSQLNNLSLTLAEYKNKLFQERLIDTTNRNFQNPEVPLLTENKVDLEEFYNNMLDQRTGFVYLRNLDADLLARGKRLIDFITKEYKLEK